MENDMETMKNYLVILYYSPDGSGGGFGTHVYAYSEFHACQLAQSQNPSMYAVSAELR